MDAIITVQQLVKAFGEFKAIDRIDFEVARGEVFGFLGPNGAGKTTTIKILATLLKPTSGRAQLAGFDVLRQPNQVRQSIGMVFQDQSLDDRLTAQENLEFHGMLYDVPSPVLRERIDSVLKVVDLSDRRSAIVRTFSGGMKRRLEIARGLLHHPKVLFLDEPTLGLDPQTRKAIWTHVMQLRQSVGITVFMTTHYMDEAEHCDRIAIIDHGRIQAVDTPRELKRMIGGDKVIVGGDRALKDDIAARCGVEVQDVDGFVHFHVPSGAEFVPRMLAEFGRRIHSIQVKQPSLDDVFLKLTGHAIRQEEGSTRDLMRQGMRLWGRR